ncbi:MAG TPA: hypothetical protein VFR48_05605 [Solirubrobacteraceae bacterium]|nr:hypothetical protein [Solirubrobacteraceae bacterium]
MQTDRHPPQPTSARPPGVPSRRVVGTLVASALAIGVLTGAALAPAPPSSLASGSTVVTRLLALLASQAQAGSHAGAAPASAPPAAAPVGASAQRSKPASANSGEASSASSSPNEAGENTSSESSTPAGSGKGEGEKKAVKLPPISHVWLIVLSGTGFADASTKPTAYPYLTGQLLKQGTLLERYSAIEGYELAGDAALLTGAIGESVSTISEPGCQTPAAAGSAGSGTTGAGGCPGNAGGQAEADSFLQRVVTPILTSSAYAERGLIVVTFGSASQEAGLSATTLAAQPPTGALLLSSTLKAGGHSSEAFNSLAPRESLEAIFGHS